MLEEIGIGHYLITNINTPHKLLELSTVDYTTVTIGLGSARQLWEIWGEGSHISIHNGTGKYLALSPPGRSYPSVMGRDEIQGWIIEKVREDYNFYCRIYAGRTGLCLAQLPGVNGNPLLQLVDTSPDWSQIWKFWQMGA
ncbi:hypothetical protein SI65_09541 [Aspergillus cristatus]|uniref:Ricin B lectin domain-containing protein n=1 Tax=Aspergillus cristatus TaxID=573508 RepID=A0A1E3B3N2_ASPCR|nr:hypothetical protein SI65_09541 [Aspergillus cristatus]